MNSRYIPAKLFFVLAVFWAMVGAVLFRRLDIGLGLTKEEYLNPAFWVTIPGLIPFAASILSTFFGIIYFGLEKRFKRPVSLLFTLVHFVSFLLAILGASALLGFLWGILVREHANNLYPVWPIPLAYVGFGNCCLAFVANIVWSMLRTPLATSTQVPLRALRPANGIPAAN